jgi:hypothetical protein
MNTRPRRALLSEATAGRPMDTNENESMSLPVLAHQTPEKTRNNSQAGETQGPFLSLAYFVADLLVSLVRVNLC